MKHDFSDFIIIVASGLMLIFCILSSSCKTIQVVEKTKEVQVHDTTQLVDSIYIDRVHYVTQKGDTVFKTDSVYVYKYKTIDKVVETLRVDSVPYVIEVVKEVKKTTPFTRFCISFFFIAILAAVGYAAWRIYRLIH